MSVSPLAIETIRLGRDYGSTRALDALDLDITSGLLVGLLGPNGAGKTTAMLLLATLLRPSRGTARLFGLDIVRERPAIRRRLGLVFQEASIDGLLSVRENLRFAAGLMGLGGASATRAVDLVLDRTGLDARAEQPARQLSGGWKRLADIARATLHRPDLLILDEPTVGLDPEHRERMWALLDAERRERGTTIIFSTHYLAEAESCDRVVLLARGKVVADDAPAMLMAGIGERVLEIEGPDADRAAQAVERSSDVRACIRTERGYRIGVTGPHDGLAAVTGASVRVTRLSSRPATLEDVYFAKTQGETSKPRPAAPSSAPGENG